MLATNQKPDHPDSNTQQQTGILQITTGGSLIYNKKVHQQKGALGNTNINYIFL